jgi:hypothetical protein
MLFFTIIACYTTGDYLEDVTEAFCECSAPSQQEECVDSQLGLYEESGLWDSCAEIAAPVSWSEVSSWANDYVANCDVNDSEPPSPNDDFWEECF